MSLTRPTNVSLEPSESSLYVCEVSKIFYTVLKSGSLRSVLDEVLLMSL